MVWERSSVWLERMPVTHEVAGSSPVVPAILLKKGQYLYCPFFSFKVRLCPNVRPKGRGASALFELAKNRDEVCADCVEFLTAGLKIQASQK